MASIPCGAMNTTAAGTGGSEGNVGLVKNRKRNGRWRGHDTLSVSKAVGGSGEVDGRTNAR